MPSQKEILTRINSVNTVKQMTKTMKMISVAKYNVISRMQKQSVQYTKILNNLKSEFVKDDTCIKRPTTKIGKDLLIVISSDKGFCGNFNNNILKKTLSFLEEVKVDNLDIFPVGKKISDSLAKRGIKTHIDYVDILKKLNIKAIGEAVVKLTLNKSYNKIFIISNHSLSFSKSMPALLTLDVNMPLPNKDTERKQFFFEPGYDDFFNKLYLMNIQTQIVKSIFESCVAEHSMRMVNMSKSTDNAEILLKKLRILYNQMRQTAITNEIIEISAGYKNI